MLGAVRRWVTHAGTATLVFAGSFPIWACDESGATEAPLSAGAAGTGALMPGAGTMAVAGAAAPLAGNAQTGGTSASPPVAGVGAAMAGVSASEVDAGMSVDAVDAGGQNDAAAAGDAIPGMGAGGMDATPGFMPCPLAEPCKILPLGDSITDGIGFSGGYRVELFRRALADGKSIEFVGGSMNGPREVDGVPFPREHEGHSGWTISQIDGIVPSPALAPEPHIVLLHIGTNDMYRSPSGAPGRLGELIDQIVAELPDALLVVSTIIPLPSSPSAVSAFNAAVPEEVEARAEQGEHVILVDQFTGFPTSELGDGVHPNQAGYARMAGVFYEAIREQLN